MAALVTSMCFYLGVIGCSGYVVTPSSAPIKLTPGDLEFGDVEIGSTASLAVSILNSGLQNLKVGGLNISGQGFALGSQPIGQQVLPAGLKQSFPVYFSPTSEGDFSGQVTLVDTGKSPLGTALIHGHGVWRRDRQLTVSGSALNFGSQTLGKPATKTLTLTSSGSDTVTINSASITGTGFTVSGATFPTAVQSGRSLQLQVTFDPLTAGSAAGTIAIATNSTSGTVQVSLSGTGTAATTPVLTVSAASLSFGNVPENTKATKALVLTSSGTAAVTVKSVNVAGSVFSLNSGSSFPLTLNPGQSLQLQVTLDPPETSNYTGTITISSNSSTSNTDIVSLSGNGISTTVPQLTVSATSLAFGSVTENTKLSKSVTLTSSGTAAVKVSAISESGTAFTLSGPTLPATLNPGQSVTAQVTFDPTAATSYSGSLTISSNSSSSGTATVSLTGSGIAAAIPTLTVSSTSLDFGSVSVGTPYTLSLTLTSTGTSPVTVSSDSLSGSGFTVAGATLPVTLSPTTAVKLTVQFDPTIVGAATGQITFASNSSSGSTTTVALKGTGTAVQHEVTLTWSPPTNSPVPVVSYNVYRSATGASSFVLVDSMPSTQTSYIDSNVQASTTYDYYVESVDSAGGTSTASNQVAVTVP